MSIRGLAPDEQYHAVNVESFGYEESCIKIMPHYNVYLDRYELRDMLKW